MKTLRHTSIALFLLTAAGCGPMMYDTSVPPPPPAYGSPAGTTTVIWPREGPEETNSNTPPVVVTHEACGLVQGAGAPDTRVELFADPWCSGEPIASVDTDEAGQFALSLCLPPGAESALSAIAIDAFGQASECSTGLSVEGF